MSLIYNEDKPIIYNHMDRLKHMSWCFSNDVFVEFVVLNWNSGFLRIHDKGEIKDEEYNYKQFKLKVREKRWSVRAFEIYTEMFNKYNKKDE